jgi:hypothetical protein
MSHRRMITQLDRHRKNKVPENVLAVLIYHLGQIWYQFINKIPPTYRLSEVLSVAKHLQNCGRLRPPV